MTKIFFLILSLFCLSLLQAQQSVNSSGGNASGSGGTFSYSMGITAYTTNTGSTGSIAQGVQHAYNITPVGIKQNTLNISLSIFPNPTTNYLTLRIDDFSAEQLSYQLYDIQGKLLDNVNISSVQTQISMEGLASATYLLHVIDQENKIVQSFKIIKN